MRTFSYNFLIKQSIPASIISTITYIYQSKGENIATKHNYPDIYSELQKQAIFLSVLGSNAIEGIVTTEERAKQLIWLNEKPKNHNEQQIQGYKNALNYIHENHEQMQFNIDTILSLHKMIYATSNQEFGGHYKTIDNCIVETWPNGERKIRFQPISYKETPQAMEQAWLAFMDAWQNSEINKLLLIPCYVLDFLSIHPFDDGNGRMSRLITVLLLYKAGFDVGRYVSFEQEINLNKNHYYASLKHSSDGWHESTNNYFPFIENFLITLANCYQKLSKYFFSTIDKFNKSKRIEQFIKTHIIPINKKEIVSFLPDISTKYVEMIFSKLLKENKIQKIGTTKDAKYIWKAKD